MPFNITCTPAKNVKDGALVSHEACSNVVVQAGEEISVFDTGVNDSLSVPVEQVAADTKRYMLKHNNRFELIVAVTLTA